LIPPRPPTVDNQCAEGFKYNEMLMECMPSKDGMKEGQQSMRPSEVKNANIDYNGAYKDYQEKMRSPVMSNAEYEDEPGQDFNFLVFFLGFIAAAIGGGIMCVAMAYCNRDKENPFEEALGQRIYVEGEDKLTDVDN